MTKPFDFPGPEPRKPMDVSLSAYNITDNRDPVATQWLPVTYEPRGSTVVLSVGVQF